MTEVAALVAAELALPVDPRVMAVAETIAARYGTATEAVLFYGSCLDGPIDGAMLDFYVIVSDYRLAYGSRWLAWLNRLLPPNVFPFSANGLSAKYAILDRTDFARLCSAQTDNPAVWARFAQPSRLVWVRGTVAVDLCVAVISKAAPALLGATAPLLTAPVTATALWERALAETYRTELRAETALRGVAIVGRASGRFDAFTGPALTAAGIAAAMHDGHVFLPVGDTQRGRSAWTRRRRRGKLLSALRLLKAAATFDGGLDYLAWKIERHSGRAVPVKSWHRRWPVIGGLTLLPQLLARGAVR